MRDRRKLAPSLLFLSLICGPCISAQENVSVTKPESSSNFPEKGYRPLPPHFQPRRIIAADPEKVNVAPPPLPSYEQPAIPGDGYLWVPGFWAWRKSVPDYFWVPGTWVHPPRPGLLWTPPYWSRVDDGYAFHEGYWGEQVGFYGGIRYGFGYTGNGFQGGQWKDGKFSYNRVLNNLGSIDIGSAYIQSTPTDGASPRISYNGGRRGTVAQPTREQKELMSSLHIEATVEQRRHFKLASMDRSLYSKLNNGEPGIAATQRVGMLAGSGVTSSRRRSDQAVSDGSGLPYDVKPRDAPSLPADQTEQPTAK